MSHLLSLTKLYRSVALIGALLLILQGNQSWGQATKMEDYAQQIERLRVLADSANGRKNLQNLTQKLAQLPENYRVALPDGEKSTDRPQEISNLWIKNWFQVKTENKDIAVSPDYLDLDDSLLIAQRLSEALSLHLAELQDWGDFEVSSDENIRNLLDNRIYEEEKEEESSSGPPGFLRRLNRIIRDNLAWITIAVLIIVLAWLGIKANQGLDMKTGVRVVKVQKGKGLLTEEDPTTFKELKAKAEDLQNQQQLNEALRYHYLSFILLLHERHILYYSASLTNWEYQRKMLSKGINANASWRITDAFDRSHYGLEPVDPAMLQDFMDHLQSCVSSLPQKKEAEA